MNPRPAGEPAPRAGGSAPPSDAVADIVLTANGPGEVTGWLEPVARRLVALRDRGVLAARIWAWVPPCNFASGRELAAVRGLGGFDGVFGPRDMWRFLLRGRPPHGFRPARRGIVLFLGGDLFYAAAAARRLGYPAMAYTEGRARWLGSYERFFVPHPRAARRAVEMGAKASRVEVVGDLVVDAVRDRLRALKGREERRTAPSTFQVGLFAGSRDYEVRWVLPLMLRAAPSISREMRDGVRFVVVRSPFVEEGLVQRIVAEELAPEDAPVEVASGGREAVMAACDLAISVPGTVTAELAVLGVPTITVLPLHRAELVPLEGLPGLLGGIPGIGPGLKRWAVLRAVRRAGPVALPSRRVGRRLGPELVGEVKAAELASEAVSLLRDRARREELSRALRDAMGPEGAADRIVRCVLQRLGTGWQRQLPIGGPEGR